ncbi:MAG: SMC-Scp complex subunit ScpB [Verrucomicrobiota bacterium]
MMNLKGIVEAIIFASSKPLSERQIVNILKKAAKATPLPETEALQETKESEIVEIVQQLQTELAERGLHLQEVGGGYRFTTHPDTANWVRQLFDEPRSFKLSASALETLAVIAYRQPTTRAEMESVRGVAVDGVLDTLLERGMVRSAGRAETPGRPVLYETTPDFLEIFGLGGLDELPNIDELRRVLVKVTEEKQAQEESNESRQTTPTDRPTGSEDSTPAE